MIAYRGFTKGPVEAVYVSAARLPYPTTTITFNGVEWQVTKCEVTIAPDCKITFSVGDAKPRFSVSP